ncbi:hypothetical protein MNBD_GAMMA10-957 [hydrothermal vent metagenome]|uniref:Uncharacterized protein n=1 Tax=hydrothermal vent metagenome TaxID=652676 RepID=A0A3B0XW23_9ZZZZ
MIDAQGENGVRSDECVGGVHISLFDLEQQQLQLTDNQGASQLIDLRTGGKNVLSLLLDNDLSYAELLYDLTGPAFEELARFSADRELIFSIGGEEALATVTPGGTVRFNNPAHINLLDGVDLLTIRLYQSNDMANVLWEYALSDSQIILHSIAQGSPENGKRAVESQVTDEYFFSALGNKKVFVNVAGYGAKDTVKLLSVEGNAFTTQPAIDQEVVFNSGYAKFVFNGGDGVVPDPVSPNKRVKVSFLITPDSQDNAKPSPFTLTTSVIIKNNSNTPLKELLEGVSVWSKTAIPTGLATAEKEKYIGKTEGATTDKQYIDYAQYMMNMITIPLIKDIKETNIKYSISPDGIYGVESESLLKALMDDNFVVSTTPPVPGFAGEELAVKQLISHFDNESKGVVLPKTEGYRTLRKLLQDYQDDNFSQTFSALDTLEKVIDAELDPINAPTLSYNDYRYRIITPEAMRGLNLNAEEGRTIAFDNAFIDKDLGIYELYQSYDWDGDGVSNLAEVEKCRAWI